MVRKTSSEYCRFWINGTKALRLASRGRTGVLFNKACLSIYRLAGFFSKGGPETHTLSINLGSEQANRERFSRRIPSQCRACRIGLVQGYPADVGTPHCTTHVNSLWGKLWRASNIYINRKNRPQFYSSFDNFKFSAASTRDNSAEFSGPAPSGVWEPLSSSLLPHVFRDPHLATFRRVPSVLLASLLCNCKVSPSDIVTRLRP